LLEDLTADNGSWHVTENRGAFETQQGAEDEARRLFGDAWRTKAYIKRATIPHKAAPGEGFLSPRPLPTVEVNRNGRPGKPVQPE
jgi:hypothetical protein